MITISEALRLLREDEQDYDKTWRIDACTYIGGVGSKASYKTLEDNIIDYEQATKKAKKYFNDYKKSEKFSNFEIQVIEVFNDGTEDVVDVYDNIDKRGGVKAIGLKLRGQGGPWQLGDVDAYVCVDPRGKKPYTILRGAGKKNYIRFNSVEEANAFKNKYDELEDSEPFRIYKEAVKDLKEDQGRKRIKREINDKLISDLMDPEYMPDSSYTWDFIDKKTGRKLTSDSGVNAELGVIKLYNGWGDVIQLPIDGSAKAGSPKDINRYEVYEYVD